MTETSWYKKGKEHSLPYYLPIAGGKIVGFISFLRILALCEKDLNSGRCVHFPWRQIFVMSTTNIYIYIYIYITTSRIQHKVNILVELYVYIYIYCWPSNLSLPLYILSSTDRQFRCITTWDAQSWDRNPPNVTLSWWHTPKPSLRLNISSVINAHVLTFICIHFAIEEICIF